MTEPGRILVTGPTGTVGGPLLTLLAEQDLDVMAGAPDPARFSGPAECRALDFERPDTFAAALAGVRRVFLMRPPAISDTKRYIRPFIQSAEQHGVEHVVFLSLMGVNRVMPHWRVEQDLRASTLRWTFLRPSFFAQNLQTAYGDDIREQSRIRVSSGRGRTSFIDTRDIAAVASLVLTDPSPHVEQAYTLTGPGALDYYQVASMLSAELGRAITYEPLGLLAYRHELRGQGLPSGYVNVQLLINVIARLGLAAKVNDTMPRLLGRPPTPLATYLHDHRDAWAAPAGIAS
jgi:uncharacterized protein YbjT (DUF2867 family)